MLLNALLIQMTATTHQSQTPLCGTPVNPITTSTPHNPRLAAQHNRTVGRVVRASQSQQPSQQHNMSLSFSHGVPQAPNKPVRHSSNNSSNNCSRRCCPSWHWYIVRRGSDGIYTLEGVHQTTPSDRTGFCSAPGALGRHPPAQPPLIQHAPLSPHGTRASRPTSRGSSRGISRGGASPAAPPHTRTAAYCRSWGVGVSCCTSVQHLSTA